MQCYRLCCACKQCSAIDYVVPANACSAIEYHVVPANKCSAKDCQFENVIVADRMKAAAIEGSTEKQPPWWAAQDQPHSGIHIENCWKAATIEGSTGAAAMEGSTEAATIENGIHICNVFVARLGNRGIGDDHRKVLPV